MRGAATPRPSASAAGGHVGVLCALAVAQPLFDLLGRNPTFFVAHHAGAVDIALFALLVAIGPPLVVLLLVVACGVPTGRSRSALLVAVAMLAALIALPPLHRVGVFSAWTALAGAATIGALAACAYARFAAVRTFLTVLTPAVLVFPLVFLLQSPVSRLVRVQEETTIRATHVRAAPPIVFVIFDSLALTSLLDGSGTVDAVRYPAFARLAGTATWYRDTNTVADLTQFAVPAILTGQYPLPSRQIPTAVDHPRNLFTLFADLYDMDVHEPITELCPGRLCGASAREPMATNQRAILADAAVVYAHLLLPPPLRHWLPPVEGRWRDFGHGDGFQSKAIGAVLADRAEAFEHFIDGIAPSPRPTIHFIHSLLPHFPFSYLPTGRTYAAPVEMPGFGNGGWHGNPAAADTGEKRYLLQLGFVDRLLGRLLDRLEQIGMFDSALLVVTSDHGCSFLPEQPHRSLRAANYYAIAPVPLFIKEPGQHEAHVRDQPLETVDVLPTVAALLGVDLPWKVDGRSALAPGQRDRRTFVLTSGKTWAAQTSMVRREEAVAMRIARLGAGTTWETMLARGAHAELIGASIGGIVAAEVAPYEVRLHGGFSPEMRDVGPVPAYVEGELFPRAGAGPGAPVVAIAVNGVVGATARALGRKGRALTFEALIADRFLRPGTNQFEVLVVDDRDPAQVRLARVPPRG